MFPSPQPLPHQSGSASWSVLWSHPIRLQIIPNHFFDPHGVLQIWSKTCSKTLQNSMFLILFVFPFFICSSIVYCLLAEFSERVFRGVQHFCCQFQDPLKWPEMVRKSLNMAPRWPPDGPQIAPRRPTMGQDSHKLDERWGNVGQDGPR